MNESPKQKTILIVEDQEDILLTLKEYLQIEGYTVVGVANGKEALDFLAREKMPNLILLDMKMPVMNGWQFSKEFLLRYNHCAPIVVLTAADDAGRRAQEVNAAGWLGKPFELNEVLEQVKKYT